MQKIWRQVGLQWHELQFLRQYMEDLHLKNESQAISELIKHVQRLQMVVSKLESKAQEASEWKERAEAHIKEKEHTDIKKEVIKSKEN